jgi:hypothetical protein
MPSKHSIDEQLTRAVHKYTLVSVDGFTRNPNGIIKFHKDNKAERKMETGDMEIDTPEDQSKGNVGPEQSEKS